MVDAYGMLCTLLLLAVAAAVLRSVICRLRWRTGDPPVRDRLLRDLAWILVLTVALLLADSLLLLLCDCSFRDFEREFRWYPSLRHEPAIVHRLVLASGMGLGIVAMWSQRTRAWCRRPLAALRTAFARCKRPQPWGVWVLVAPMALGVLLLLVGCLETVQWFASGWQWESFERGRGLDDFDFAMLGHAVVAPVMAWALAMLACQLCGRSRVAWRITLGIAVVAFVSCAAMTVHYVLASGGPRSHLAMGIPELAAAMYALPALFALWAMVYLVAKRARFDGGGETP